MEQPDEGCLKVANSLIKRIKAKYPQTTVVSYGRISCVSDKHMQLNKFFLNRELLAFLRKKKETVLYIPNASATVASAARVFVLSVFSQQRIKLLVALGYKANILTKILMKLSKVELICLSKESAAYYQKVTGRNVTNIKTGVDIHKFVPVHSQQKKELRQKYGIAEDDIVVLHVGHLKKGRNLDKLCLLGSRYRVVLVISSATRGDISLKEKLMKCPNISIIENYVERIEELYQMADVYFFPVVHAENCIDVPLSVLEAAACGLPAVVTAYGELQEFRDCPGFYFLDRFDARSVEAAVEQMLACPQGINRSAVLEYDWDRVIDDLVEGDAGGKN